ncbi:MAG: tripartite tricarboxylate transporter substrate binding protein [Burkholderiales bacterium]
MTRTIVGAAVALLLGVSLGEAVAASAAKSDGGAAYPVRPIRVVVPFTPGGQPDIFSRMVGEKLVHSLGQQIGVDNRPGAGGMMGSKTVAEATPDGYTLLSISAAHSIAPAVRKLPYDVLRDFAGISMLYNAAYLLVVPPALGIKTTQELVALAKAKPGELNFASAGTGSGTHFAAEMFKYAAKIDIVHIAYKGIPEAMTDTMANRVQIFMAPLASSVGLVKEGKLRGLGMTSPTRIALYPDIPTIAEAGMPGFRWDSWGAMFAPARTPRAIVAKLNREVVAILNQPDIQKRMRALGAEPAPTTSAELDKHVAQELAMVFKLAKAAGLEPQ